MEESKLDGVRCEPGLMIRSEDGGWWVCEGQGYVAMAVPKCTSREVLVYGKEGWECRAEGGVDALWVILGLALVFTLGSLGVGLTQWWRNRKAQKAAEKQATTISNLFDLGSMLDTGKVQGSGVVEPPTKESIMVDVKATNEIERINLLNEQIKAIYMEIQLGRGEINKIAGMVQVYVNSAMKHLDTARDKTAAMGGMIK